jgi:hypothetical protein
LYDQLQLLQVLVTLDEMQLEPGQVTIVQSDHYLGSMTADELTALHPKRRTVTAAVYESARSAWAAFTAGDPRALRQHAARDAPGLPFLRAALLRLCQEFPWTGDGLSRSQRHALQSVAQGSVRAEELFRRAQAREEAPFLGDLAFYAILRDLQSPPAPLVEGGESQLELNSLGRSVLAGGEDWLEMQPLDRWVGGVHLLGSGTYRWDDLAGGFVCVPGDADS